MTAGPAYGLSSGLLDQVSPFHIVLDAGLKIRQVGSSLRRIHPGEVDGQHLENVVEVVSPRGDLTWSSLASKRGSLFVLKLRGRDLRLRGQLLADDESGVLIFVGSPWITDLAALAELDLTLEDFSVSDNVVDYLLLLQTQGTALAQARTLAADLQRSAAELKARSRRLRRLTHERESVLNSAADGIYGLDASGVVTFVNDAAVRLLRTARADMLGRKVDEVIRMEGTPVSPGFEVEPGERESPRPITGLHRRADGSYFDCELISAPILEDGGVVGSVVVFRDISERRAVDRMKDEFISLVSHELRTPLTSIRGALGLLGSGSTGHLEPHAARMVEVATMSTDRLVRLINDILDVERMAVGKLAVHPQPTPVRALIEPAVAEMTGLAQSCGVHLRTTQVDGAALADADRIVQTLNNLLGNAVKFSEAGSTVEVGATVASDWVRFDVRDTGPGIPVDQLEAVFEPFKQVDSSDTRAKGGSGLGLAICRGLVECHGGRIWAASTLGEGTVMSFTLPTAAYAGAT